MTYFNAQVAETISNIVSFDTAGGFHVAQIALAAALFQSSSGRLRLGTSGFQLVNPMH